MSLESYILKQRVFCESPSCLSKATVCQEIDGGYRVSCWQHDPETIADFSSWLATRQDSIVPDSMEDWLRQNDDAIIQ